MPFDYGGTYEAPWRGASNHHYDEIGGTWSAAYFWLVGFAGFYQLRGREFFRINLIMSIMGLYLGMAGFWFHALGRPPHLQWVEIAAQEMALIQACVWSVAGFGRPWLPWYLVAPVFAHLVLFLSAPLLVTLNGALFSGTLAALWHQEFRRSNCQRRRWGGLLWLVVLCVALGVAMACEGDTAIALGRLGHVPIHFVEGTLMYSFHQFWVQREEALISCCAGNE